MTARNLTTVKPNDIGNRFISLSRTTRRRHKLSYGIIPWQQISQAGERIHPEDVGATITITTAGELALIRP